MKFKTRKEAEQHFNPMLPASEIDKEKDIQHWGKVNPSLKMGEWCLFKHVTYKNRKTQVSKPILGLIVGHNFWDMVLVLEYVTEWRAWEVNTKVQTNSELDIYMYISEEGKDVKNIQFWTDNIIIMGRWETKPSFKELLKTYKEYEKRN